MCIIVCRGCGCTLSAGSEASVIAGWSRRSERECVWSRDADGNWETTCGSCYCLEDHLPGNQLSYNYCPNCGGKVRIDKSAETQTETTLNPAP